MLQVWDVPRLQRPHGAPRYGSHMSSAQSGAAAAVPTLEPPPAPPPTNSQLPIIKRGTRGVARQQVTHPTHVTSCGHTLC